MPDSPHVPLQNYQMNFLNTCYFKPTYCIRQNWILILSMNDVILT